MAPPYAIIFMDSLKEDILSNSLLKPLVWWLYIDDIFMVWEHWEEDLKKFLETLNCYHPIIKFTAEYSRAKINFLDVTVIKKGNQLVTDLYVNRLTHINIFMLVRVTFLIVKNQYLSAKPCVLREFVLKAPFLIIDVMNWRYG